jgi:hypothetical protein
MLDLEKKGLVISAQLEENKWDKRKWYRIDMDAVWALMQSTEVIMMERAKKRASNIQNLVSSMAQETVHISELESEQESKPIAATPDGLQTRGLSPNTSTMLEAIESAPASSQAPDLAEEPEQAPNPEPLPFMVEEQSSISPAPAKAKKAKKPRERNPMYDAVEEVFNLMAARNTQYQRLLSGTPIAPFTEYVHEELRANPVTPEEVRAWAQWWKQQHPALTLVSKPDTMPKSILEWRARHAPREESPQVRQALEARSAMLQDLMGA